MPEIGNLGNCHSDAVVPRPWVTKATPQHASRHHVQDSIHRECWVLVTNYVDVTTHEAQNYRTLGISASTQAIKIDAFALSYGHTHMSRNANIYYPDTTSYLPSTIKISIFSMPKVDIINCHREALILRPWVTNVPPQRASRHHLQDSIHRECWVHVAEYVSGTAREARNYSTLGLSTLPEALKVEAFAFLYGLLEWQETLMFFALSLHLTSPIYQIL